MPSVIDPQQSGSMRETTGQAQTREPIKRNNTLKNHFERTPKEKAILPPKAGGNISSSKFQEKARIAKKNSVQPIPLKSSKPWPTSSKRDELIKHMSNVPSYLQRSIHNGDNNNINNINNIQGKALNFGVLEWGALEKYTTQKNNPIKDTSSSSSSSSKKQFEPIHVHDKKIRNSFSGEFTGERTPRIPHSCPLPHEGFKNRENVKNVMDSSDRVSTVGSNQMNRSSSLKERPSTPPSILFSEKINEERESSNKQRRQSPLRRMLDPLLRPHSKDYKESGPLNSLRRSVDGTGTAGTGTSTRSQDDKKDSTTRQALLQLAWKNGLPLFMLSFGDSEILAATMKRKYFSISEKDNNDINNNEEGRYSIVTVQESKKKVGNVMWNNIKQGNKNKKQQLVSNVVGEVRVSLSKSKCSNNSQNCHLSRQFILTNSNNPDSNLNLNTDAPVLSSELAAIITNLPQKDCFCVKSSSLNVILPSGIHGNSSSGSEEPSPLIQRWKMGGGCDCGGWDEGCALTILNNDCHNSSSQRFELFTQGRSKEEGCSFSMTCFKEGLYTVEFNSSIDLVQAFVMCISFLHGRNFMKRELEERGRVEGESFGRKSPSGIVTNSYVPHHPPLSPVGRA